MVQSKETSAAAAAQEVPPRLQRSADPDKLKTILSAEARAAARADDPAGPGSSGHGLAQK
jgi:hypothetical protein